MSRENSPQATGRASQKTRSFAVMFLTLIFLLSAGTAVFAGKSTLGDYVWIDYNRNDQKDDGPTGINGVVINVYKDDGNGTFSPVLDSLVAISTTVNEPVNVDGDNTNPGEPGYYDVPVNDGNHWVHIPASNFAPGGPLEGLTYTGSGQVLPDGSIVLFQNVPIQGDIDTADFGFVRVDWGDLPDDDATAGDDSPASPGYNTNMTGTVGASHVITPGLRIGPSVDAETNGQPNATATGDDSARTPDDENGVTMPAMFVAGSSATITISLVNTTSSSATLYGFIDWNGDGDFLDSVEKLTVVVPPNTTQATFTYGIPVTATLTQQVGARFRLSTDATLGADGAAPDGEIEDYLIQVVGYDWGDLPDGNATTSPNYHTDNAGAIVGPSHLIDADLRLGATEDAEANGQPTATANGDDTMTSDDENGIATFPQFVAGSSTVITVSAYNTTGVAATLYGFIDWNADGDFGDTGEQVSVAVPNGTNGNVALNVTVPLTASTTSDLGARFRLSTDAGLGAYGPASNGEVEDYLVRVSRFDLALRKVKSAPAGAVLPGGLVTFTITISNQGTIDARNIVVTDYITGGFTFTPNNGWTGASPAISTTIAGPLLAGQSTTKILVLRVATNFYGTQLTNTAEISSADDDGNPNTPPPTDVDSTPDTTPGNDGTPKDDVTTENHKTNPNDDEDDHDPALVPVAQIRDLAIAKSDAPEARPGDLVTFTLTITNEGTVPMSNIRVTDTFTNALSAPVGNVTNSNNGWVVGPIANTLVTTITGPLAPNAVITKLVVLQINPAYRGSLLTNTASVPPDDNPPGEPPDDEDPGVVPVKYFDLALRKVAANTTVEPGKTVTFTIEVHNQGTLPAHNIQVSDYFTSAFVFTPAVGLNTGWSAVSATQVNRIIAGPVAPGSMTTVQLVLQVPITYTITGIITNTAEISAADDDTNPANVPPTDVDSTPDTTPNNDGTIIDNLLTGDHKNNPTQDEDDHDPAPVLVTYNPTAVQIAKAAVRKSADGMAVSWSTESESELVGFNLFRLVNGQMQQVNSSMIAAQKPGQADGASYQVIDSAAGGQNAVYVLEIISSDGSIGYVYLGENAQILKIFAPVIIAKR